MRKLAMILCVVMLLSVFGGVPMSPVTVQAEETVSGNPRQENS